MMAIAGTEAMMASRPVEIGKMGQHVTEAVARLRGERGWDQRELAERVTRAGRPVSASVLSKIESGARRIDVDDLVAIAAALEVSPALLLLAAPAAEAGQAPPGPPVNASVAAAVREDIEALGDLTGLEPSLAQMACRLATAIDAGGGEDGRLLPALNRELRATLAQLVEGRAKEDDDDLGDLAEPE
ncbi:helix-turn-helix transcriptional regulator [Sphaerisporangium sp. NPDC051011]|uniref:helix-turn-helix domain-containing protein n=1 Tax=Sphaerisporangium sp. NPDC051011 TaxID=3155792 RepID=UPI0033D5508C